MDKLYDYGLSELFLLIALSGAKKYNINLDFSHLDSSSFSVHGQYNQVLSSDLESQEKESEVEAIPISITHGYSRDHRLLFKTICFRLNRNRRWKYPSIY